MITGKIKNQSCSKSTVDNNKKYIITERTSFFEPNIYISMVVTLNGNLDQIKNNIQEAISMAYRMNETTMSQIVLDGEGNAYYERRKETGCTIIFDVRNWKSIIKESEKQTFAIDKGELIRTYIIQQKTDQNITLLIMAHHLAGDGKSILIFIEDILNCLNGEEGKFKSMYLIDQNYLLDRAKFSGRIKYWTEKMNKKWYRTGRAFTWEDYYRLHDVYWKMHTSEIELETFDVQKLKNECKDILLYSKNKFNRSSDSKSYNSKHITLNSYMITKMLQKYPGKRVVGIPISIREEKKEQADAMSNQTSGTSVKGNYNNKKSFSENALTVHKKIYRKLNSCDHRYFVLLFLSYLNPSLTDSVLMNTYGCYDNKLSRKIAYIMGYLGDGGTNIGITNLEQINIEGNYNYFSISDIIFIPPKVSYAKEIYGIATYRNKLTLSHHIC